MEDCGAGETEESSSPSFSSSGKTCANAATYTVPRGNAHILNLLVKEVLPYSPLGVLHNQSVVSPPLALVATAPAVRVYCEDHMPYSLGGTWWLAHTTTHCLVRCRVPSCPGKIHNDVASIASTDPLAPDGVERVFAYTRPPCHRQESTHHTSRCEAAVPSTNDDATAQKDEGEREDRGATDDQDTEAALCWVAEEALLLAQQQERERQREQRGGRTQGSTSSSSASLSAVPIDSGDRFIARHSGVQALVPPQLTSNRRLLSFVRGVPGSFLGFCTLAAQHGWQHAARTLLRHTLEMETPERDECGSTSAKRVWQPAGPARLYVVHTQLFAICGYPESRMAHSTWWILRRTASAMGPASLLALNVNSHEPALMYAPAVISQTQTAKWNDNGEPLSVAHCVDERAQHSLQRYHSRQQLSSLQTALRHTREHQGMAAPPRHGARRTEQTWLVTNACSLIVSGDVTFWSGTSTVDASALLQQHWFPFFRPCARIHPPIQSTPNDASRLDQNRNDKAACACADGQRSALPPLPLPPPCSLFLHGTVVLAVEHKLHRDAVRASEAARARAQREGGHDSADTPAEPNVQDGAAGSSEQRRRTQEGSEAEAEEDEEEEEEVVDVQPLFSDMGDDGDEDGGSTHQQTTQSNLVDASEEPTALGVGATGLQGGTVTTPTAAASSSPAFSYDPHEERFLGEIAHRQSFQLLHCVDVTYLRLPLGPELVAERPLHPTTQPHRHRFSQRTTTQHATAANGDEDGEDNADDVADARGDVWDARWLWCLFPRVQVLDMEGPPSFTHASSAAGVKKGSAAAPSGRAGALAVARQYRQMVRPREISLTLGAAAAAQTCTVPLYTIDGLWRLRELRRVVLRAYPFQVLPLLEAPPKSLSQAPALPCEQTSSLLESKRAREDAGCVEGNLTCRCSSPRTMELSVMGWPYVNASGLRGLVTTRAGVDGVAPCHAHGDASSTALEDSAQEGGGRSHTVSEVDYSMLSLTHMDSLAFVDALQGVFPSVAAHSPHARSLPLSPVLSLNTLTHLELSKTRVTTAALTRMHLPLHTPQLQVLRLSSTPVDSVASLRALHSLRVLNLSGTRVSRRGLRFVQWMASLEELFLTQCECLCDRVEDVVEDDGDEDGVYDAGAMEAEEEGDGAASGLNLFSLGVVRAGRNGALVQPGTDGQSFPRLRVLDVSNNPQLTERALSCHAGDAVLCAAVTRYPRPTHTSSAAAAQRCGSPPCGSGRWSASPWCTGRPTVAHMPRLETLHLMHTAVTRLACLLTLCPHLRTLDVSFTPLREEGLSAHVLCPRHVPLENHVDGSSYVVQFPSPLHLHQLNLSGTPLSSLHALSEAPPQTWAYNALDEKGKSAGHVSADRPRRADEVPCAVNVKREQVQRALSSSPSTAAATVAAADAAPTLANEIAFGTEVCEPDLPALRLRPHPAILDDCRFDVHLRTQAAWRQHLHDHPGVLSPHAPTEDTRDAAARRCGSSAVRRVAHGSGYTICVDVAHWGADGGANRSGNESFNTNYGARFDMAAQWSSFSPLNNSERPRRSFSSPPAGPAGAEVDVAGAARGTSPLSPGVGADAFFAADMGGVVRYAVLTLSGVRQLRLGHGNITAGGLAAGYGMPHQHRGEGCTGIGLVELSLRGAAFLCPPYAPEALRGEVPPAVAMTLHAHAPHPPLPRDGPARGTVEAERAGSDRLDPLASTAAAVTGGGGNVGSASGGGRGADATAGWTEAEALCAVLRCHRVSLHTLDLSRTSVSLTTLFEYVHSTPATSSTSTAGTSPSLTGSAQWEDILTQGPVMKAAPVLTTLLLTPSAVLDSRVQPSMTMHRCLPHQRARHRKQHRTTLHPRVSSTSMTACLLLAQSAQTRTARGSSSGVLSLPHLHVLAVEDTPLATSLKRLFPRLYNCAVDVSQGEDGEQRWEETEVQQQQQQRYGEGESTASGAAEEAAEVGGLLERHIDSGDSDTDVADTSSEAAHAVSTSLVESFPHRRRQLDTVQMRHVWEALLHELFGDACKVQY